MIYVYIGCLAFGVVYSIISAIFGAYGHGHANFDHGAAGGHDANSANVPSPFNPLVISSAIASFGAVGIIARTGFKMGDLLSSVFALSFAGIIGAAIFFGVVKLMYSSQSDSSFSQEELIGMEAEIITPIPEKGMGEIAYVINGERYSLPARSVSNERIGRGEKVKIREISGNVALVTHRMTIDDLEILEIENQKTTVNREIENE